MTAETVQAEGWYISRDGEMDGPLSDADMRGAIGRGAVKPEHLVWRDGMALWVEAREIPNYNELRKAQLAAELADGREKSRDRVRAQKSWAANASSVKPARGAEARAEAAARSTVTTPASVRPSPAAKLQTAPWALPKTADGQFDFEKITNKALGKLSGVPPGAIAFFVLGLIFPMLLPIFWFVAWRIYTKAKS